MALFQPTFTTEEFNELVNLLNIAVKTNGLVDDIDVKSRKIINKIAESKVKETPTESNVVI